MRCIIIGAGVSGLLMVHKIREAFGDQVSVQIFEKNTDIGGTWFENRYPGCACDVPSHIYQYSFAPNPYWSRLFVSSSEIHQYLKAFTKHFDIEKYIQFSTYVTRAEWCEDTSTWSVEVDGTTTYQCELLFNASGILSNPYYPHLRNLDQFSGEVLHTAAWKDDIDLTGKRIAIIGAGASGIQLLPALQPHVSHIDMYIRTTSWITTPLGVADDEPANKQYSEEEISRFMKDEEYSLQTRKQIESYLNSMFRTFMKGSEEQKTARAKSEALMREEIRDLNLQQKLIPDFDAGCKRLNPGKPYLEALQKPNVQPVFGSIQEITPTGIRSGDQDRPVEAIVLATGFDTSFRPRFPIIGRNKCNLQTLWEHDPVAYFGLSVSGFPNYLHFLGPNTPIANGSVIGSLEATADYFIAIMHKMRVENAGSFNVLPQAQADFEQHTQALMKNMVWTGNCRSWYKNDNTGRVTAIWPGSALHYREVLAARRFEDYEWKYNGNRFAHWGEGFSAMEKRTDDKRDLSYYILPHPNLPKSLFSGDQDASAEDDKALTGPEKAVKVEKFPSVQNGGSDSDVTEVKEVKDVDAAPQLLRRKVKTIRRSVKHWLCLPDK